MSVWQNLTVEQNNDTTFTLSLVSANGPFDLTAYTPTVYVKASETADDGTAVTFTVGSGLTIIDEVGGRVAWKLPHANTGTAGTQWWRIDVIDGSLNRTTAIKGSLTIEAV